MNLVRKRVELPILPCTTEVLTTKSAFKQRAQDSAGGEFVRYLRYTRHEGKALEKSISIAREQLMELASLCTAQLVDVVYGLYNIRDESTDAPIRNDDITLPPEGFQLVGIVRVIEGFECYPENQYGMFGSAATREIADGINSYIAATQQGELYAGDAARLGQFGIDAIGNRWLVDPDPVLWKK